MTKDKDEKAIIRARMARTGESYAAARAQLARGAAEPSGGEPDDAHGAPSGSGDPFSGTPAAGRALTASRGSTSSAWHLVLAISATHSIGARVLAGLGLPYRTEAPPVEPDSPAAHTWAEAVAVGTRLAGRERHGLLDTGVLLRGAVQVLLPEHVPAEHGRLLTVLQEADLEALCTDAWAEHGPEGDDRAPRTGEGLFTRFTGPARAVVVAAQAEARDLRHGYIGTEHLLLGLLAEGEDVAVQSLTALDIRTDALRARIIEIIGEGSEPVPPHLPFTPRAKKLLELALTVALDLRHAHVGTEHLLIAMVEEGEGIAAQVLREAGCTADVVRADVLARLAPPEAPPSATTP